jgi:hypothetical protein
LGLRSLELDLAGAASAPSTIPFPGPREPETTRSAVGN